MARVNKDMIIADILEIDSGIAQILRNAGMNCVGCPGASAETLGGSAPGHGVDVDALVEEINVYLESKV